MSNEILSNHLLEHEFSVAWNAANRILSKQSKTFHINEQTLQGIIGVLSEAETAISNSDHLKSRQTLEEFWCKIKGEICGSDYRLTIRETATR